MVDVKRKESSEPSHFDSRRSWTWRSDDALCEFPKSQHGVAGAIGVLPDEELSETPPRCSRELTHARARRKAKGMCVAYTQRCECDKDECGRTPEIAANFVPKGGSWGTRHVEWEVMLEGPDEEGKTDNRSDEKEGKKKIHCLQRMKKGAGSIDACTEDKSKWKCISIAVDSGACDNVIPPQELPGYEDRIGDTPASRNGDDFVSASGDTIPNYGELKVPVVTRELTARGMTFQAAGVAKPLGSVKRMLQAGHRVVFDPEMSYIQNTSTGEMNFLREEDGNFMLDVWVPPPAVAEAAGFTRHP